LPEARLSGSRRNLAEDERMSDGMGSADD
jgi:hypothetical protein